MNKTAAYKMLTPGLPGALEIPTGHPSFPAAYADLAYRRALQHHPRADSPHVLHDPFCGVGAILCTVAALHRANLERVSGSDIDPAIADIARRNLELCTPQAARAAGQRTLVANVMRHTPERMEDFAKMLEHYGATTPVDSSFFAHDMLQPIPASGVPQDSVSLVITDPPYGKLSSFAGAPSGHPTDDDMLRLYETSLGVLRPTLQDGAVVAFIIDRRLTAAKALALPSGYALRDDRQATGMTGPNYRKIHILQAV